MSNDPSGFPQSTPPNDGLPKIKSVFDFTAEALEELAVWLEQRGLTTPISQIPGFAQFTAQTATQIPDAQTTTSTTYVDLATAGPTISLLPNGKYVVFLEARVKTSLAGVAAIMGVSVNGAAAVDADAINTDSTSDTTLMHAFLATLSAGSNTLQAKYRVGGAATGTFTQRQLIAFKYANL